MLRLVAAVFLSLAFATSAAAQSSPIIARIKQDGVLRVAMADSPPSQSKNSATDA
jgi:hypothetical protein